MLVATISEAWAEGVKPQDVWAYNSSNAEELMREIDIPKLGGLAIVLTEKIIWDNEDKESLATSCGIIDLSFDQPAIRTSTERLWLNASARLGYDAEITKQIGKRRHGDRFHGPDEPWFFPLNGLVLTETTDLSTARQFPVPQGS